MTQFQTDLSSLQQVNATNPSQSQNQNSMNADYQNLLTALNSVQDATKSGNQDQITKAQNALQQAMNQFQTDVPSLQQSQGHHHHHHHQGAFGSQSGASCSPSSRKCRQFQLHHEQSPFFSCSGPCVWKQWAIPEHCQRGELKHHDLRM